MIYKDQFDNGYSILLKITNYSNNDNLAIQMFCQESAHFFIPYAMLTTNLGFALPKNQACVDTNNLPNALKFIKKYNLGEIVGNAHSGFCDYPIVEFNMNEVKKHEL